MFGQVVRMDSPHGVQPWATGIADEVDYPADQFGRQIAELGHSVGMRMGCVSSQALLLTKYAPRPLW
jgi:hypothetical protein